MEAAVGVLVIAVWVFLAGFVFGRHRRTLLEHEGEADIRELLFRSFPSPESHVLNNVTLLSGEATTQVDHILVSTRGVFVIETKHYSGWIFGDERSKYWTQVIYKNKHKFQNPLRQNFKHVKAVENVLEFLPRKSIHNIVVFSGSAEFKTDIPSGVFSPSMLVRYIASCPEEALSQKRVAFSVGRLECARYRISSQTDIEHQWNLHKRYGTE